MENPVTKLNEEIERAEHYHCEKQALQNVENHVFRTVAADFYIRKFRPLVVRLNSFYLIHSVLVEVFYRRRREEYRKPYRAVYKRPKQNSVNHTRGEYKREHACEVARGEYFD